MKKWMTIIWVNLIFLSIAVGQTELPLLQPNYSWDIYHWEQGGVTFYESASRQYIRGDTIIDGVEYKVIRSQSYQPVSAPVFVPPFELVGPERIAGFMREDLTEKKVYSRGVNADDAEILTYNFNLNIGDTLLLPYLDRLKAVVDTIEQIDLPGGETRRLFRFRANQYLDINNDFYIEGIGGASTLLFPFDYNFESGGDIGCVRSGNTQLYGTECLSIVGTTELKTSIAQIYPNPTTHTVWLDIETGGAINTLRLFSAEGQIIREVSFRENSYSIALDEYPAGLYYLDLLTSVGHQQFKLIKL